MKTSKLLVAFAAVAFAGLAAADTRDVGVSASVTATCKFTGHTDVTFGAVDPDVGAANVTGGSVTFWCTKGTSYSMSTNNGSHASGSQRRMKGPGATDFIDYTLSLSKDGTGAGKTAPITVNASGSIAASAVQDATEGSYADTVTVSVTP